MPEIGIIETKNIIRTIKQKYDYDFSHYALTAFRFALDKSMIRHHLKYPELLASRILEDDAFFDEFLFEITKTSLELFRDPETWNLLKSIIFPQFFEAFDKPNIWFPYACNGQDLFSLLILLKTEYPGKSITIDISALSEKTIYMISRGEISPKQLESGLENYERVSPHVDIYTFLKPKGNEFVLDYSLFKGISFTMQNLLFEPHPENTGMIFYRNNLLNYSPEHQKTILDRFTSILELDGYLITGIKENIDDYISKSQNLLLISKNEKVYKKIK